MLVAQSSTSSSIPEFVRSTSSSNNNNNNNTNNNNTNNNTNNNHSNARINSTYHHQQQQPSPPTHQTQSSSSLKSNHQTSKYNHQSAHIPHSHPSNLVHPFPPPHLMISPQPYSFNPHSLSPQLAIFNPLIFHSNQHQLHQSDQISPTFSRPSSTSTSRNSSPSGHSDYLSHQSKHKLQSYPQPLYAQAHSHRGSNSSLPSSHHSRPSIGTGTGTGTGSSLVQNSRPSSIHIPSRTRTDSTQSDRTPVLTNSHHRIRRDSSTKPSSTTSSPRASPALQPHDPFSQINQNPTLTKPNSNHPSMSNLNSSSSNPHPPRPHAMVRKPSPLAQGTRSPAPPPGASPAAVPAPSSPALAESKVDLASEENSEETISEPDQVLDPSTPSTSVDRMSTTTTSTPTGFPNPTLNVPNTGFKPKPKLGFKLRRALSIGALHDDMIQSSIPESGPAQLTSLNRSNTLLSPSVITSSDPLVTSKPPKSNGTSRRFGLLNSRANSSTDNLSISSTVSSASVMIRKLGNLGRTARRNSVMGLTKIFKDNKKENLTSMNEESREEEESKKGKKTNEGMKVVVSEEESLDGLTPAAAFILKQKQEYAQREAAAAKSHHHKPNSANGSSSSSSKKLEKPMGVVSGNQSEGNGVDPNESRKKMIEKEKEKLKNKWKWGSSFGQTSQSTQQTSSSSSVLQNPLQTNSETDENDDDDDETTLRGKEVLKEDDQDGSDEAIREERESYDVDEYDAESLFGNSVTLPMKEALPKKGILKSVNGEPMINRRATFAQNLSVHSTWPPAIYDRRGGPATCNRLTPSLAQRIKEELNAFKMDEMEVHHSSRVHTHFFV